MSSKLHVLIPDGCSTWALTVLSCLSYNKDYKFFVLSNSKRTATKYSKFTSYYKYYERPSDDEWLQFLAKEIKENNISVVVPIAEKEIGFCIRNLDALREMTNVIPLPDLFAFEKAVDKYKLSKYLQEHQLAGPKFAYFHTGKEISESIIDFNFPVLLKPLHEKGGDGIKRFDDLESLKAFAQEESENDPVFIQELIKGYDIDCSVICMDGEVLNYTIQKGNLLGDGPYAPQLGFDFIREDRVIERVKEVMQKLNWSGVAHLDMRYDSKTDKFNLIEINARFWGSLDGSRVAGINFPDMAINLAVNKRLDKSDYNTMPYLRLKGVLKRLKSRPTLIFKRGFLNKNTEMSSFFRDPLPTGFKFLEWLNRRF